MSRLLLPKNLGKIFFWVGLVILLLTLWQSRFFLTGDGPTHLYNAKVLLDHWQGHNTDFYSTYYTLNSNPEPNWLGHLLLAGLHSFLPAWLAEKFLLMGIVLLFAFGARFAVRSVNPEQEGLTVLFFPFLFTDPFHMGFYNFCFSLGIFLYLIGYWLRHKDQFNWKSLLVLALLFCLQYFTHPVTLVAAGLVMAGSTFYNFVLEGIPKRFKGLYFWEKYLKLAGSLVLTALPALAILLWFLARKGMGNPGESKPFKTLLLELWHMSTLVWQPPSEGALAKIVLLTFGLLILLGMFLSLFQDRKAAGRGLGFASMLMLVLYFISPDNLAGGGIIQMRLQLFPFFCLILWLTSMPLNDSMQRTIPGAFFIFLCLFFGLRLGTYRALGKAVQEIRSAKVHIPARSTVLPLSFAHAGKKPDGSPLMKGLWLFVHAADYLGADKSLVMFDNYEGNTGFFPVIWNEKVNPYLHLSTGPGQEALPPAVDLKQYAATGGRVDFILTWCMDDTYAENPDFQRLQNQLAEEYEKIFVSEAGRVSLYQWKTKH